MAMILSIKLLKMRNLSEKGYLELEKVKLEKKNPCTIEERDALQVKLENKNMSVPAVVSESVQASVQIFQIKKPRKLVRAPQKSL